MIKGDYDYEGNHFSRRIRNTSLSADHGNVQTAAFSSLRQTHDLLSHVRADECRIRDILIISTPQDTCRFEELLGDGHQFGVHLTYEIQPSPDGLAQAFIIGEQFIGNDCVAMILGDNIFAGQGLNKRLKNAVVTAEIRYGSHRIWLLCR